VDVTFGFGDGYAALLKTTLHHQLGNSMALQRRHLQIG
jgi:hypothetical protein